MMYWLSWNVDTKSIPIAPNPSMCGIPYLFYLPPAVGPLPSTPEALL